jgi:hypothetical protein
VQFALKIGISAVRFGTEKNIGFPRLNAIFDSGVTHESSCQGRPWGRFPPIMSGLAEC